MDALKAHRNTLRGADCLEVLFGLEKRDCVRAMQLTFRPNVECVCGSEIVDDLETHLDVPFQSSCLRHKLMEIAVSIAMEDYEGRQRTK
ncbi:uncharacterized protein EAF01_002060 [Botrytis porri]|uniref:uncharacterized protein n=1 Tax=Botrytis porri TaxID=87229 RepID=UPI001902815A|nr:uncharacterized protein EAF01_002060 [Botrytis porri]KAF7913039.1 hypothetical protein EAF01_002060 [Botrytis porri]